MQLIYPHKGRRHCNSPDRSWFLLSLVVINLMIQHKFLFATFQLCGLSSLDTNINMTVSVAIQKWHIPTHIFCDPPTFLVTEHIAYKKSDWQDWRPTHLSGAKADMQHRASSLHVVPLPVCISFGCCEPISKSKSINQFLWHVQSWPLWWHSAFVPTVLVGSVTEMFIH